MVRGSLFARRCLLSRQLRRKRRRRQSSLHTVGGRARLRVYVNGRWHSTQIAVTSVEAAFLLEIGPLQPFAFLWNHIDEAGREIVDGVWGPGTVVARRSRPPEVRPNLGQAELAGACHRRTETD